MKKKIRPTKIIFICTIILSIILTTLLFSRCCYEVVTIFDPTYYKDEDLLFFMGRDSLEYEYSNRAQIIISHESNDTLVLKDESDSRNSNDSDKSFFTDGETVLSGSFVKHAWNDYKLFILMEDLYYVYDLKKAPDAIYDEDGNFSYELKEYSENDFSKLYPEQDIFEWELLDTRRDIVLDRIGMILPESAEFTEYEDTRKTSEYYSTGYFSATIKLQDDKETEKFIRKIKKKWVKPPIIDPEYNQIINQQTFSEDLVPCYFNYYYFYSYSGEPNSEGKYTIATFDEETKTIYFYTSEDY